ncbi:MAG: PIN domain-containing protein [Methanophagales archaeon]|nr:PIN domain-containing protein [Methanophagales archaeon]MCW3141892.1 PIN domain-containing protein [Methanophagales archaeon]
MNMKYLLDTKALIAFFNNEDGAEFVEKVLREVDENKAEGFVSSITLTEIYYLYSRRLDEDFAKERIEQIRMSNLKTVAVDEETAIKAGQYKIETIPIADALIAASAHFIGAKVVTDDEHFEKTDLKIARFRKNR